MTLKQRPMMCSLTLRLPVVLYAKLNEIAEEEQRTVSEVTRQILTVALSLDENGKPVSR
jgi:predicted transcriptional regulator